MTSPEQDSGLLSSRLASNATTQKPTVVQPLSAVQTTTGLSRELFSDGLCAPALAVQLDYSHDNLGWYPTWTADLHPGAAGSRQSFAGALTDLAALLGGDGDTDIGKQPLAVITGIGAVTVEKSPPVSLRALEQLGSVELVARGPIECAHQEAIGNAAFDGCYRDRAAGHLVGRCAAHHVRDDVHQLVALRLGISGQPVALGA